MTVQDVDLDIREVPTESNILIKDRFEVLGILRLLAKRQSVITTLFYPGDYVLVTSALKVDDKAGQLILDIGPNAGANRQITESGLIAFSARLQGAIIQFFAEKIEQVSFEGNDAFCIAIPKSVIKLEHRDYHRIKIPVATPMTCTVQGADGTRHALSALDVSLTGISMLVPGELAEAMSVGNILRNCTIGLGGNERIEVSIAVVRLWQGEKPQDKAKTVAGCLFIDLKQNDESKLSRYIQKLEVENLSRIDR